MTFKTLLQSLKKTEKILLTFLFLLIVWMGFYIGRAFYYDHTEILPVSGGDYVEGAVGEVGVLNPLLVQQGSLSDDISRLIFSGLTKYNPETGDILPDLAEFTVSSNRKEYTFVLKEGVKWHDGKPLTADDVLFTYNTVIANPQFKGAILNYNDYTGVKVSKIDDRTVQFLLEKPDSFFLVKTMVGLLPEHLLRNEPIEFLETSPFNFSPIGSGPYKFVSLTPFPDHAEYNLVAFEDYYAGPLSIQTISFKVFPLLEDLQANLNLLDGVRNVPKELKAELEENKKFSLISYQLPQYVALFINNDSKTLEDGKVRLALQLGTDKEEIIENLGETKTIDSPLLEINQEDWRLIYDVKKANGALFDTQWKIPDREAVQEKIEAAEGEAQELAQKPTGTEAVQYINSPNGGKDWTTTQSGFTMTGTAPEGIEKIVIRGYTLQEFKPGSANWSYKVDEKAYENLFPGENVFKVMGYTATGEEKLLDAITINYISQQDLSEEEKESIFLQNQTAPPLPLRTNEKGENLVLNLITTQSPQAYPDIARLLEQQWKKIGVGLNIEVLDPATFQERLNKRDYDLLIFGQNLGYNLDAYPYWHSSQAKEGGLNLSQFKNFIADNLLEKARLANDEVERLETLNELQETISAEVPAIFLYSPTYYFALSAKVQNATFNNLATTTDRLDGIEKWSSQVKRKWKEEVGFLSFFPWIIDQF